MSQDWVKLGKAADFQKSEVTEAAVNGKRVAVTFKDGKFGVISGTCLHAGGPLTQGEIRNDYVVCPWHSWQFHRLTGEARPGIV